MSKYKIEVELLSESIFGSGYSIPGSVDMEIVYDENGFPYMKAKTFKGNLRESMENTIELLGRDKYENIINNLLGKSEGGVDSWKTLKFSDCRLSKNLREVLKCEIKSRKIEALEVKEALTNVRSSTSIDDDGSYKKGSLRQFRVIKKGLVFESEIDCERVLQDIEIGVLAISLRSLRHIGTMRTRGKGQVDCRILLFEDGVYKDKTDYYIEKTLKGENSIV